MMQIQRSGEPFGLEKEVAPVCQIETGAAIGMPVHGGLQPGDGTRHLVEPIP